VVYIYIIIKNKTKKIMDATISKNAYSNLYIVKKWDDNNNVVETFTTKKKHLAHEKFSQFFRETYNI